MSTTSPTTALASRPASPGSRLATLPPWDFDAGVRTLGFEAIRWADGNQIADFHRASQAG